MAHEIPSFENFSKLKNLCTCLIQNPKNSSCIQELNELLKQSTQSFIKVVQPTIFSTFYPILKNISEDKNSYKNDEKQLIVETLKNVVSKSSVDKLGLFFNIYSFLLFEIYDHSQHKVLPISEEYKMCILECTTWMTKNISSEILFELYQKQNAPKLCQILYVSIEIAKKEKMKALKIAAIKCIMSVARILDDEDFLDIVVRKQVSEVFLFFLPGLASGLRQITLEDEKYGHKVQLVALKAWGRLVTLMMQNYNTSSNQLDSDSIKEVINRRDKQNNTKEKQTLSVTDASIGNKHRWKNNVEIQEYLNNSKINSDWYRDTDKNLQPLVVEFMKLTNHPHYRIRLELSIMCELLINNCFTNMPKSCCHLIEIVITLTEDDHEEVLVHSKNILTNLSSHLSLSAFKDLLDTLKDGFINGINRLPRTFNSVDEREQLTSLNLLTGYLYVFGVHNLEQVLLTSCHLNKLLQTLIHISELENGSIGLLEEHSVKDLDISGNLIPMWINFRNFKKETVKIKLKKLCNALGQFGTFKLISDALLDILIYEPEHRKEAIFILNEVMSGINYSDGSSQIIKDILNTYLSNTYLQVPLVVCVDEFGHSYTLAEVLHNAIQVCLLLEGVGKIALVMKEHFNVFMFKILYLLLEKAGNNHSLVRAAALLALKNVTMACGYSSLTTLVTQNIDYFSYHVERKLNKPGDQEAVLTVFSVVMKYCSVDVLEYVANIIEEVLMLSCDRFKENYATTYLQVFKSFIHILWKWFDIKIQIEPIISKDQKFQEMDPFEVSGIENQENTSDDTLEKSAEELFNEDMQKSQKELKKEIEEPDVEEYKKPEPPVHIKLTTSILKRSLHFLPSKNHERKLLVLEILSTGLELIRDWEDELLPIVHQIWSPLVERFKEFDDPVIVNGSFRLLVTLARLSKEFIRMRTTKEALPIIFEILQKLSRESLLQDKGSAYRYSQNYKLQLLILENLGRLLIDIDVQEEIMVTALDRIFKYLSDKQPLPLQIAAVESLKAICMYDVKLADNKVNIWKEFQDEEFKKNITQLLTIIEEIKG